MYLTEEEAKKKVCPVMGLEKSSLPDPYTDEHGVEPLLCKASRCMAWRWNNERRENSIDDFPIELLELSVRATNALRGCDNKQSDINTIGKLRALSEHDAMRRKNFGRKSWVEIQNALKCLDAGEIPFFLKKRMAETDKVQIGYCGLACKPEIGD